MLPGPRAHALLHLYERRDAAYTVRDMPPKTEAELLRFIRDLEAFVKSARDEGSTTDPEIVRNAEARLASLERELRRLRDLHRP